MVKQNNTKAATRRKQAGSRKRSAKKVEKPSIRKQVVQNSKALLARRPHRSFRRTKRRDYVRPLTLPGYLAFTHEVASHLWTYRRVFGALVLTYMIATAVLVGLASQEIFAQLTDTLQGLGTDIFEGGWGEIGKASLLLIVGISGDFSPQLSEAQQIFAALLFLMAWLSSVWLIRAHMAGGAPSLRDALYNSGSPIISTVIVSLLILVQMIPAAIGIVAYSAAISTDFFSAGALAMMVAIVAFLLIVLSLYLITSSFFALIVVTLPGMYPWQALRTAGDLVTGRRLRILLRLVWGAVIAMVGWVIVMLPIMIFATWLQTSFERLAWIPIVPVSLALVASASTVFISAYIYMLYRKVVDDDARPA
jgi:hypothetical protein